MSKQADPDARNYGARDGADTPETVSGEGLVRRWSRRKQDAARLDSSARTAAVQAPADEQAASRADTDRPDKVLTDADMPALESLDADSDYSPFLSPGVSQQLRRLALRKLFHLPAFNVTDGLDDYAEDFTKFTALGEIVTHDMRRIAERQARARQRTQANETPPQDHAAAEAESAPESSTSADLEPVAGQPDAVAEVSAEPLEPAPADEPDQASPL